MHRRPVCNPLEHSLSRRAFLGGVAAGTLGFAGLAQNAGAKQVAKAHKRVLWIYLNGASSQLETWDPKPGTNTGGPFHAIPTSVPGIHICELLPETAKRMHHLALIRGINTNQNSHPEGRYIMERGRRREPAVDYPHIGAVFTKLTADPANPLPGFVHLRASGDSTFDKSEATFLGAKYAPLTLPDGKPPANLDRPNGLSVALEQQRNLLRNRINQRFASGRPSADAEAYVSSFEQAENLISRRDVFDLEREPTKVREKYGDHELGRRCLMARRLLEQGVPFVKVTHNNYDTHFENFDNHVRLLAEFDMAFSTTIDDLYERGMLETTLVVVMSEFGRTPSINRGDGRDHWSKAWSVCVAGCGLKSGAVVGKTNANGTEVIDREVHGGHLFHTYYRALGLDPTKNLYTPDERPIPMADPKASAISELLA